MKRFHFSLAALQTVRERAEKAALESFGARLRERNEAVASLRRVDEERTEAAATMCSVMRAGSLVGELRSMSWSMTALDMRRKQCQGILDRAERAVADALRGLIEAQRQRKVVDNLFEKRKLAHQREEAREEQKFLDDIGMRAAGLLAETSKAAAAGSRPGSKKSIPSFPYLRSGEKPKVT